MANRQNVQLNQSLLALTNLTTNATSKSISNTGARGFLAKLNVTSLGGGAPTAIIALMAKNPADGTYVQLAATTAITLAAGLNVAEFYPGLSGTSPMVNVAVPSDFQVKITAGGTGSISGNLYGELLV